MKWGKHEWNGLKALLLRAVLEVSEMNEVK